MTMRSWGFRDTLGFDACRLSVAVVSAVSLALLQVRPRGAGEV